MMRYTIQTTLMEILPNNIFAKFVVASPIMAVNPTFKRAEFQSMQPGTLFVAKFKTNGIRRQFVRIYRTEDMSLSALSFIEEFRTTIVAECGRTGELLNTSLRAHMRVHKTADKYSKQTNKLIENITSFKDTMQAGDSDKKLIFGYEKKEDIDEIEKEEPKVAAPCWIEGIFFEGSMKTAFETAVNLTNDGLPVNVLMTGPSGYGKTSLPLAFAKSLGMKAFRMNCPIVRDSEEFFGYREAIDGNTVFVKSEFTKIIEAGNAIVVLDELNRLESWLHNLLFPLLDDDRKTTVHGEKIVVGENVVFVATINEGFQYTGTFEMDQALRNRMDMTIHVGAMPPAKEAKLLMQRTKLEKSTAIKIVKAIREIRMLVDAGELDIDASTRTTIKCGKLVRGGMAFADAIKYTITNNLDNDQGKLVSDKIGKFLL